jgi:hypothetical protein
MLEGEKTKMTAKPFPCIFCPKGKRLIDADSIDASYEFMRCTCPAYKNYLAWLNEHCKGYDDA